MPHLGRPFSARASLATLLLLVHHVYPTLAFFRLATGVLVTERADPIVAPGKTSGHAHSVAGGFNFATQLTYDMLRASNCTSSGVLQDKSAYWTPLAYFWHKNGSFIAPSIQNQGQQIYYAYNVDEGREPFPEGFRMLAGSPYARTYKPPTGASQYTEYDCLDYKTNPKSKGFPTQICPYGVRMNVYFPECGDGRLLSSDQSHVAYRVDGKCPSTHPHFYPQLHYELYWSNTEDEKKGILWKDGMNPAQPFVLSQGDPTGFGAHGDFFNGWETSVLKGALKQCTGASPGNPGDGRAETCPLFTITEPSKCRKQGNSPDVGNNEQVSGWLKALPGCNAITYTEADALAHAQKVCNPDTHQTGAATTTVVAPTTGKVSSTTKKTSTTSKAATTSSKLTTKTTSKAMPTATSSTRTSATTPNTTKTSACSVKTVVSTVTKVSTKTVTVTATATPGKLRLHRAAVGH